MLFPSNYYLRTFNSPRFATIEMKVSIRIACSVRVLLFALVLLFFHIVRLPFCGE